MNRREFVVAAVALVAAWITGKRVAWRKIFAAPQSVGLLDCMHSTVVHPLGAYTANRWRADEGVGVITGVEDGVITVAWS